MSAQGAAQTLSSARLLGWWVAAATALGLIAGLGGQPSLGSHPVRSAALHGGLLLLLIPLIQGFPFRRRAARWVLALSVASRLLMLPLAPSDDVHRYVWEGRMLAHGYNPYVVAPDDPRLAPLRDAAWERINHKSFTAIYPPGSLLFFRAITALTTNPVHYKWILGALDVAVVLLLLGLLREMDRRPGWVLLYALNPVVLTSFAGEAHVDVLLVGLTTASLWCFHRRRYGWMFWWLGLSIHVKYVSVLLIPFLMHRQTLHRFWLLPAALVLPALSFAPWDGLFNSLAAFSSEMHFNGSLHQLFGWLLDDYVTVSALCALLVLAWCAACRLCVPRPIDGAALGMSGLLLLSPNVHFWYLTWLLPWLCFRPFPPMLVFNATVACTYATLGHHVETNVWREFPAMLWLEYLPVYGVLIASIGFGRPARTLHDACSRRPVRTLSVVVPALQEANGISAFLHRLRPLDVCEILVCDGGSTDGTPEVARRAGVRVLRTEPGRGRQIAAGIQAAAGDAVLVVHTDGQVSPDVPGRILAALNRTGRLGGAVGCRFDPEHPFLRLISSVNGWRARLAGISFGDQGQFFRREALAAAGGFPELPIMEDVEWSLRLRQREQPLYLGGGILASTRRWTRVGKLRNAVVVSRICVLYLVRRFRHGPGCGVDDIYRRYYPDADQARCPGPLGDAE